ncbi:MAG: OmpH family outer membrane protein [Flavobacteriaceae bacterium]|nr:OmpH family outer membrane protein [Flavobacteriaceae bacterium]
MVALAQKGVRIGYIDTDYILENVPEYQEINQQLNSNVEQWRKEIENREKEIKNKRDLLNKERILLTVELIQEREEDLKIEEEEVYEYKQNRFGPNGDFILQKKQLIQPIQDQIFLAIQEIAKTKKYDFIFDKSADIVMLYSDKRYDISEQILSTILRSNNQKQVESRREKKKLEKESIVSKSDVEDPRKAELENKKRVAEERRIIIESRDAKKKEAEQKINKLIEEREAKKKEDIENKKRILEERKKKKQEVEDKRKKSLENKKEVEMTNSSNSTAREKLLLERKKKKEESLKAKAPKKIEKNENSSPTIEERKKSLEEKKKKILEARKAKLDAKKISKDSTFTKN